MAMHLITEQPFGAHPDDRVALLKPDGTECDYRPYVRVAAGRWHREGSELVNDQYLAWPRAVGPGFNLVAAIALYRGTRIVGQKWLHNDGKPGAMRIFDKVQISISPGNIRVPVEG